MASAKFDRAAGTTHLVTHRASQAAAAQRAGRAARQGPGVAYRLWEEGGHGGRPVFDPPEMLTADLSPLVLSLAQWGTADPGELAWLDPPPQPSVAAARQTLAALDALLRWRTFHGDMAVLTEMVASDPFAGHRAKATTLLRFAGMVARAA